MGKMGISHVLKSNFWGIWYRKKDIVPPLKDEQDTTICAVCIECIIPATKKPRVKRPCPIYFSVNFRMLILNPADHAFGGSRKGRDNGEIHFQNENGGIKWATKIREKF